MNFNPEHERRKRRNLKVSDLHIISLIVIDCNNSSFFLGYPTVPLNIADAG